MSPDYIIFSDASVKLNGEQSTSAYAAVILNCHTKNYTVIGDILHHRSISFCEGWAIYQGLRYVNHLRKRAKHKRVKVLVVTDSKLNVQIITEWIRDKWDTSDWYNWKKSTRGEVLNQDLYRLIVKVLNKPSMKVRLIHMRSHTGKNRKKRRTIVAELAKADVNVSDDLVDMFIEMNALADETAHEQVRQQLKHPERYPRLQYRNGVRLFQ